MDEDDTSRPYNPYVWVNPLDPGFYKVEDSAGAFAVPAIAGTAWTNPDNLLNLIRGVNNQQRIGDKIRLRKLYLNWTSSLAPTSTGGSLVRCVIVYDTQTRRSSPAAITDLFTFNSFSSDYNYSGTNRFRVIFDHISDPLSVNGNYTYNHRCVIDLTGLETIFISGAVVGNIADIRSGSLLIYFSQTDGLDVAPGSTVYNTEVRYTDA